jgi:hypothetical protein
MVSQSRRRAADDAADEEDDDEVLAVGTAVALAAFQALVASGADPMAAIKECWRYPVDFMVGRRAWWAAVQEAFTDDG